MPGIVSAVSTRSSKKRKLADTDLTPAEQMNPSKRRENAVGQMIDFLEQLRQSRNPVTTTQKKVK